MGCSGSRLYNLRGRDGIRELAIPARPMKGLFITGTDTGVGKTRVAVGVIQALRARGVRVGAYKPLVTGSITSTEGPQWEDASRLQAALGDGTPIEWICPQRFRAPLAPPVASRLEGREADASLLRSGL